MRPYVYRDSTSSWKVLPEFAPEEVAERVVEIVRRVSAADEGREVLLVGVLKGAWVFMADLVRRLTIPVCCDFVRLSSYGLEMETSGEPRLPLDLTEDVAGRNLQVVTRYSFNAESKATAIVVARIGASLRLRLGVKRVCGSLVPGG